jgi:hypothetical protein
MEWMPSHGLHVVLAGRDWSGPDLSWSPGLGATAGPGTPAVSLPLIKTPPTVNFLPGESRIAACAPGNTGRKLLVPSAVALSTGTTRSSGKRLAALSSARKQARSFWRSENERQ